jgi:hypothetical protein
MEDLDDVPAFTDAPDEDESLQLTKLGRELYSVDKKIQDLEADLESAKARREDLVRRELPDYLKKIAQDKIGLPEFDVDLVLENYYHANIKADWPDAQRERAFAYLEKRGDGDLIKTQVVMMFGRTELWKVRWLQATISLLAQELRKAGEEAPEIPEPYIQMTIPWNTLTAFVKEQVELGAQLDLDILGASVGQVVKIKKRKK